MALSTSKSKDKGTISKRNESKAKSSIKEKQITAKKIEKIIYKSLEWNLVKLSEISKMLGIFIEEPVNNITKKLFCMKEKAEKRDKMQN